MVAKPAQRYFIAFLVLLLNKNIFDSFIFSEILRWLRRQLAHNIVILLASMTSYRLDSHLKIKESIREWSESCEQGMIDGTTEFF